MTIGEISLLIGLVANAGSIFYLAMRSGSMMNRVIIDVHKIELATNSMKDALVTATEKAAHAAGRDEERIEAERRAAKLKRENDKC